MEGNVKAVELVVYEWWSNGTFGAPLYVACS